MNNHSYIVYAWRDKDQEPYFVSKCRSDSDAPYKDKKNILAPSDPSHIVVTMYDNAYSQIEEVEARLNPTTMKALAIGIRKTLSLS